MRALLAAAVVFAAAAASAAGATPHPTTLYSRTSGAIAGFAQDDGIIAWFTPAAKSCNAVHVRQLDNGVTAELPKQDDAHNVTCRWSVGHALVSLALAGDAPSLLWTLHESTPLEFEYLVGATVGHRTERRFQQLAHTSRGAGLWFGGVAGSGKTLVYGVTSVDYVDEAGCLAGTDSCSLKIVHDGGGVYRVTPKMKLVQVPGTTAAVEVATASGRVAYVQADSVDKQGRPVAGADLPIEVVDAVTGKVVASITPQGTPVAIALSAHVLATLEQTPLGLRLAWYSPDTGTAVGSVPVALDASPELSVSDDIAVYHVRRSIRAVDISTSHPRALATAASAPIGLSVVGGRVAWAENLKQGGARIRALWTSGR